MIRDTRVLSFASSGFSPFPRVRASWPFSFFPLLFFLDSLAVAYPLPTQEREFIVRLCANFTPLPPSVFVPVFQISRTGGGFSSIP